MARESSNCSPVEITYSILKPFLSGADQDSVELPPYYEIDPRNGVSNRSIAVHVQTRLPKREGRRVSYPFDEIEFSLHGVIKSQVGNKIARRKVSAPGIQFDFRITNRCFCTDRSLCRAKEMVRFQQTSAWQEHPKLPSRRRTLLRPELPA